MVLPSLYAGWVGELLGGDLPDETEATCDRCAMLAPPGSPTTAGFFDPRTKCCTYVPDLPSFAVGRILRDDDPAGARGRASVLERMESRAGVTPLGLMRSRAWELLYNRSEGAFGRATTMRCPHYVERDGGGCGVWRHRAAICATWHCKYVRGAVGQGLWRAALRLLQRLEVTVALDCARALGVGREALEGLGAAPKGSGAEPPLSAHDLDGTADPDEYARRWGAWRGRERAYYVACAERVDAMTWPEVLATGGAEAAIAADALRDAARAHASDALPAAARLATYSVVAATEDAVRVSTYNGYDPLELPRPLAAALHRFDGRPLRVVLDELAFDDVEVDTDAVRRLLDFKVLEPA